jgi:hypothetical protein
VTAFMRQFHDRCVERHLPPLDALVVHVAGPREGVPSTGYFTVNGQMDPFSGTGRPEDAIRAVEFWENEKAAVYEWGIRHRRGRV